jgi:hypothetical protein
VAATFQYFEAFTDMGGDAVALANRIAGREPASFEAWARANFRTPVI